MTSAGPASGLTSITYDIILWQVASYRVRQKSVAEENRTPYPLSPRFLRTCHSSDPSKRVVKGHSAAPISRNLLFWEGLCNILTRIVGSGMCIRAAEWHPIRLGGLTPFRRIVDCAVSSPTRSSPSRMDSPHRWQDPTETPIHLSTYHRGPDVWVKHYIYRSFRA